MQPDYVWMPDNLHYRYFSLNLKHIGKDEEVNITNYTDKRSMNQALNA